jgi:hypothetical protein
MNEQQRTKRISLEIEKLKQELARQDRELAYMQRDCDVSDEAVDACIAELDEKAGADRRHEGSKARARRSVPTNAFIVRG